MARNHFDEREVGQLELHIVKRMPIVQGHETIGQQIDKLVALAAQEGDELTELRFKFSSEDNRR